MKDVNPCSPPNAPGRSLVGAAAFLVSLAALASGCSIFDPENPPAPGSGGADFRLPDLSITPDSVLFSLEEGIETKNVDLYLHAFTESTTLADVGFHAFFDEQDKLDYQVSTGTSPPEDWRFDDEFTFFPLFAGTFPVDYEVFLEPDPERPDVFTDPNSDVTLFRKYRVWAQSAPVAVGIADLRIRRVGVNELWKIVLWEDRRDTTATGVRTFGRRRLDSLGNTQ